MRGWLQNACFRARHDRQCKCPSAPPPIRARAPTTSRAELTWSRLSSVPNTFSLSASGSSFSAALKAPAASSFEKVPDSCTWCTTRVSAHGVGHSVQDCKARTHCATHRTLARRARHTVPLQRTLACGHRVQPRTLAPAPHAAPAPRANPPGTQAEAAADLQSREDTSLTKRRQRTQLLQARQHLDGSLLQAWRQAEARELGEAGRQRR
jgi:hypothetical protein